MLTSPADTLVCDTVQIAKWQSNPAYDYNRELITPEINVFEWLSRRGGGGVVEKDIRQPFCRRIFRTYIDLSGHCYFGAYYMVSL